MLTIEWFEGDRAELADLFALADDSAQLVLGYRDSGRVLVARDGGVVIGHLQLIGGEVGGEAEVKSLAVSERHHRRGVGRMLVERAIAVAREAGVATLLVATATADPGVLRFYQLLGFRMLRVERDMFTPEAGYSEIDVCGIPLRDGVWLSLELKRAAAGGNRRPRSPRQRPC